MANPAEQTKHLWAQTRTVANIERSGDGMLIHTLTHDWNVPAYIAATLAELHERSGMHIEVDSITVTETTFYMSPDTIESAAFSLLTLTSMQTSASNINIKMPVFAVVRVTNPADGTSMAYTTTLARAPRTAILRAVLADALGIMVPNVTHTTAVTFVLPLSYAQYAVPASESVHDLAEWREVIVAATRDWDARDTPRADMQRIAAGQFPVFEHTLVLDKATVRALWASGLTTIDVGTPEIDVLRSLEIGMQRAAGAYGGVYHF